MLAFLADGGSTEPIVVVPEFMTGISLVVWMAVTVLMPLVVGLVTKPTTPAKVQSILLVVLALVNGFLSEALEKGSDYNWSDGLLQFLVSLVIAVATHYGVWRPIGATRSVLNVGTTRDERIPPAV